MRPILFDSRGSALLMLDGENVSHVVGDRWAAKPETAIHISRPTPRPVHPGLDEHVGQRYSFMQFGLQTHCLPDEGVATNQVLCKRITDVVVIPERRPVVLLHDFVSTLAQARCHEAARRLGGFGDELRYDFTSAERFSNYWNGLVRQRPC